MNINNHIINNNSQNIDLTNVQPGNNRRATRNGSEDETVLNPETAAEKNKNAENAENNMMKTTTDKLPKIVVQKTSPRKNKGKEKKTRDPSPVNNFISIISNRKRGANEFDHLLTVVKQEESKKRRRDTAIEETKRLKTRENVEIRRLELKMTERAAIRKHEYTIKQLRVLGPEITKK